MAQQKPYVDRIRLAACKVLNDYGLMQVPINVQAVAEKLGGIVSYESFDDDLSGVLVKDKDRIVIGVNSYHAKTRQRFTIAHECGHLVLKHQGEIFVDRTVMKRDGRSAQATDWQEIEANAFAAELLMPEDLILEAVHRRQQKNTEDRSTQFIDELAAEFQVSPQAMEYRLTNLGMFMPQ